MPNLDDEDMKAISKMLNTAISERLDRFEKKQADAHAKAIEEAVGTKLAEATKAQAEAAQKPNPEAEERKTLTQRVKELEASNKAKDDALKAEKLSTGFRKAWGDAKFAPDLADEHMAYLDKAGRLIVEEGGNVRVRDPNKAPEEVQPTLGEYIGALAKSDRGKLYTPPPPTKGGGLFPRTEANGTGRAHHPGALDAVFGGETTE